LKLISRIDELILVAIWKLGKNAYGMAVREEIIRATGMNWLLGAIYGPLARLHRQGLVTSVKGEPTPERGGRAKVYYELTPAGKAALKTIREVSAEMWKGSRRIEA
jgi:PadR family transcriptional regulator PadR